MLPTQVIERITFGHPEQYNNEILGSLAYVPMERTDYWQLYKPSMWESEWEKMTFRYHYSTSDITCDERGD